MYPLYWRYVILLVRPQCPVNRSLLDQIIRVKLSYYVARSFQTLLAIGMLGFKTLLNLTFFMLISAQVWHFR
ncbi:hypothetical protein [Coxiella endosymbiont of Rhipicephalus microplus]|uniref:hypothetical protein n=1 Tax=Coxiella endosymbiont of Rhipicephalus microplus TaxID=1656186 RepID=UPI0012FFD899|nr:hypothetical protein [Coxiella endosymbiont of Rhipicephalus microplus]